MKLLFTEWNYFSLAGIVARYRWNVCSRRIQLWAEFSDCPLTDSYVPPPPIPPSELLCSAHVSLHGRSRRVWRNLAISVIGFSGKMVLFAWRPWHLFVIGESWPKKKQFFDETPVEELIADQRLISIYFVSTSRKTLMNNRIFSEQPETILNFDDENYNKKWKT